MNGQDAELPLDELRALYDDIELVIVFDWLGLQRPAALAGHSLKLRRAEGGADEGAGPIRLIASVDGYSDGNALGNAVARMGLSKIQGRLPQWGVIRSDGGVLLARQPISRRKAAVELMPRFLFMINWADSGPGYSWPESYYATYLPGFHRYVVTASQDSPDMHGYTDEAIGSFDAGLPLVEGVRQVVMDWWGRQATDGSQCRWAYIFQTGEIDEESATAWADEVWIDEDEDEGTA